MELRIRELRKAKGLSQTELATMLGVSLRTVGSWERGENSPDAEQVFNCARALDCTPNDILGWTKPTLTDSEQKVKDALQGLINKGVL